MKFIINSQTLLRKLQSLSGVINSSNTLPILDDFLFELDETLLRVTATDLETTMVMTLEPSMADEPGKITIQAKLLLDFLKYLPDAPLTFTIDQTTLAVEILSSQGKYKLTGHNADDYPMLPQLSDTNAVEISSALLAAGISKTVFATGNDELRPVMGGVFFELTPDYITFVATDAHKLVRYRRLDAKLDISAAFIVPRKPLNVLKNLLANEEFPVKVDYNITNASFAFNGVTLYSRLIEGKYPAYEAVIPKDNKNLLTVDRLMFINSVKRLSPFANQSTHQVRLKISGQELLMNAEDIDYSNEVLSAWPAYTKARTWKSASTRNFCLIWSATSKPRRFVLNFPGPPVQGSFCR